MEVAKEEARVEVKAVEMVVVTAGVWVEAKAVELGAATATGAGAKAAAARPRVAQEHQ